MHCKIEVKDSSHEVPLVHCSGLHSPHPGMPVRRATAAQALSRLKEVLQIELNMRIDRGLE